MKLASPLLKNVLYPGLATTGYFRRRREGELSVVTYHGVLPKGYQSTDSVLDGNLISVEMLRAQIGLLKSHYHVVHAADVLQWLEGRKPLPPRAVLLTCDDGLRNVLTDMAPVLIGEGISCLFFVTGLSTGDDSRMLWYEQLYLLMMSVASGTLSLPELNLTSRLGNKEQRRSVWWSWVRELSRCKVEIREKSLEDVRVQAGITAELQPRYHTEAEENRFYLMTASELRQLAALGMPIGSHTMSHPVLSQASSDAVDFEMSESRRVLESLTGGQVWSMAYPFGDPASVGLRELQSAEHSGYKCAFLNTGGAFRLESSHYAIPRTHVTADMNLAEFEAHISGFHETLRQHFGRLSTAPCA